MSANAANPVHAALSALDAIQLTRRLIDIESITYNECAVGQFLADFLASRGFAAEKMVVQQDRESRCQGREVRSAMMVNIIRTQHNASELLQDDATPEALAPIGTAVPARAPRARCAGKKKRRLTDAASAKIKRVLSINLWGQNL